MKKTKGKLCYLCGNIIDSDSEGDGDHIPPRNIFPTNISGNLITVPTHKRCNNNFSDFDETFRNYLTAGCYENIKAKELHKTKVKRSLVGNKRKRLLRKLKDQVITDEGELIKGPLFLIEADDQGLMPQFNRIIKGLYYHKLKKPLPSSVSIEVYFKGINEFDNIGFKPAWTEVAKDVFRYFLHTQEDDDTKGISGIVFYNKLFCLGIFS